jgi:hypothetical protein
MDFNCATSYVVCVSLTDFLSSFYVSFSFILLTLHTCHSSIFPSSFGFVRILFFFSNILPFLRLEVLTAASMKMAVSWVVASCDLVAVYRRFRVLTASIIRANKTSEIRGCSLYVFYTITHYYCYYIHFVVFLCFFL